MTMSPTMQGGGLGIVDPPVGAEPSGGECGRRSRCFELLGYNIMVGSNLRPILIKVNHLPSWGTDTPLDRDVKFCAITQALRAIDVNARDKKSFECARRRRSLAPIAAARRGSLVGGFPLDDNVVDAMDLKGSDNQPNGDVNVCPMDGRRLDNKERMLKDYDRIYPPSDKAGVSQAMYSEMEKFAASMDAKQHQRLTCPSQKKYADCDVVENQTSGQSNRRNSWMGNIPRATTIGGGTKVSRPPTKKQIESADRLSRGYSSAEDAA